VRIAPGSEPASGSVSPKQRALHRDEAADAGVARLELLADEAVHHRARLGQPVTLEVHPEQAEPRKLRDQLGGKLAALEPLADVRLDLIRDELAHRVANRALLVGEEGVEREEVARVELRLLRGRCHPRIVRIYAVRRPRGIV
jgi:hypothetical protein